MSDRSHPGTWPHAGTFRAGDSGSAEASPNDGQAGFTVIELIISLVLIGLVLALTGAGIRVISTSFDRGALAVTEQEMLTRAVEVLRNDISRLQRSVRRDDRRLQYLFQGQGDALRFVAIEPGYPTNPGPFAIALVVRRSGDVTTLTRSRAAVGGANIELDRLVYTDDVVLIEGAYSIEFSYREPTRGRPSWTSFWSDRNRMPDLIQVEIKAAGSSRPVLPAVFMRPLIDAEFACARGGGGAAAPGADKDANQDPGAQPKEDSDAADPGEPGDQTGTTPPKLSDTMASQPQQAQATMKGACSSREGVLPAELPAESAQKQSGQGNTRTPQEQQ